MTSHSWRGPVTSADARRWRNKPDPKGAFLIAFLGCVFACFLLAAGVQHALARLVRWRRG